MCLGCAQLLSRVQLFCDCTDCSPPASSVHGDSPGKNAGVDCHTPSRGSSQPTDGTQVSRVAGGDSLLSEPPEKPKNTGVGSPSLLQGNFPTQESNWGLRHCRWILSQLSCQGSPTVSEYSVNQSVLIECTLCSRNPAVREAHAFSVLLELAVS